MKMRWKDWKTRRREGIDEYKMNGKNTKNGKTEADSDSGKLSMETGSYLAAPLRGAPLP